MAKRSERMISLMSTPPHPSSLVQRILVIFGLLLYLATGFFYLTAGLVVPGFFLVALWAIWFAGLWYVIRLVKDWSWWTLLAGPAAFAFWWAYLSAGGALLDWTA